MDAKSTNPAKRSAMLGYPVRFALLALLLALAAPRQVRATPTQEDVFRSIQENVGNETPGAGDKAIPFVVAGAGLVILLAALSNRRKREVSPRTLNNHTKLVKEIMRTVPLRQAEVRQLKMLLDVQTGDQRPRHPLTLILCPSVLATALKSNRPAKMDRKVMIQIAKKVGLSTTSSRR